MEFTPLLFTPRTGDRLPDYTTPRSATLERSPTGGGAYAASRLGPTFRESTPRRRSMTPSGSIMEPSPLPPPPGGSLFESPTGASHSQSAGYGPPAASLAWPPAPAGPPPDRVGAAPPTLALAPQDALLPVAAGNWVTAFGFAPADRPLVLEALAACGDVLAFGSGREDAVNWVHLQFSNKHQAQRALSRDGVLLAGRVMLGVRPLDAAHRSDAERVAAAGGGELRAAPPLPPARPYRVDATAVRALPQQAPSAWARVSEYVFGF